jgi:starch synthase
VTGALPIALAKFGVEMRSLVPGYPVVMQAIKHSTPVKQYALFGGRAALRRQRSPGSTFSCSTRRISTTVPAAPMAMRPAPTGRTTGSVSRRYRASARDIAKGRCGSFRPDVVHAHDWQAALTLAYMHFGPAHDVPTVITVHNLAFQGQFRAGIFGSLGLPRPGDVVDGVEYYGGVGYLKAACNRPGRSPPSARPMRRKSAPGVRHGPRGADQSARRRPPRHRQRHRHRCLEPATDASGGPIDGRDAGKARRQPSGGRGALRARRAPGPILCVVSRLTWQKGMDLLVARADASSPPAPKLVVLGSGDARSRARLLAAASRHRGRIGVVIGYDEALSHLMQGGCDAILIPSRFEPCGLTQLYGLRYGCVPWSPAPAAWPTR